ncbi:hypothetical protein BC834DRAFT_880899 [Gloeopeniophorella convolvens]|nr:hypothetical protein BC834DRAFT_880899 [Gloeopeniophorella convolvens]
MVSDEPEQQPDAARRDAQLTARAANRKERSDARRAEAETHKKKGNAHFRAGEYRDAIREYQIAVIKHGPRAAYLANLAAAWLKLGEWDAADDCANAALDHDPKFTKARYRRGLARKANLQLSAAAVDFRTVLAQDPNSTEAKVALEETLALLKERNVKDNPRPRRWAKPNNAPPPECEPIELESVSDSSDCRHMGNAKPCPRYNHDGCTRGTQCKLSHAPDYKSVRDKLGRNVCLSFLLGTCKRDEERCVYAHDKAYLGSNGWWDDPERQYMYRATVEGIRKTEPPEWTIFALGRMENKFLWNSVGVAEMAEQVRGARTAADGTLAYTLRRTGGSSDKPRTYAQIAEQRKGKNTER